MKSKAKMAAVSASLSVAGCLLAPSVSQAYSYAEGKIGLQLAASSQESDWNQWLEQTPRYALWESWLSVDNDGATLPTTKLEVDSDGDGASDILVNPLSNLGGGFYGNKPEEGSIVKVSNPVAPYQNVILKGDADKATVTYKPVTIPINLGSRRAFMRFEGSPLAQVDLHVWKYTNPLRPDDGDVAHLFYRNAAVENGTGALTGTKLFSKDLPGGTGRSSFVDYPVKASTVTPSTLPQGRTVLGDKFDLGGKGTTDAVRISGYTFGVCQYSGSNAKVTVDIVGDDGKITTHQTTLANPKDAWLVGQIGNTALNNRAPIPNPGWCKPNSVSDKNIVTSTFDPTKIGIAPGPVEGPKPPEPKPVATWAHFSKFTAKKSSMLTVQASKDVTSVSVSFRKVKTKTRKTVNVKVANGFGSVKAPATPGTYIVSFKTGGKRIGLDTLTVKR